jgi:GNAT superfamily N-acetyltransferase
MSIVRPFAARDLDSLCAISLATGDAGRDASPLHTDGRMIGHIYSAPYGLLAPELAFVAEDDEGVAGYVVGTSDTRAFDAQLERDWWPSLRAQYADPSGTDPQSWTADQKRSFGIHHPNVTPEAVAGPFPAHLHMNLLPRLQGAGLGRKLFERWAEQARTMGVRGLHVGVSATNRRGMGFWQAMGFERIPDVGGAIWLGQTLG